MHLVSGLHYCRQAMRAVTYACVHRAGICNRDLHCKTDLQGEKSKCYSPVSILLICQILIRLQLLVALLRLGTWKEAYYNKGY